MALETTKWDLANAFREPEDIGVYLQIEFEDYVPQGMSHVLDAILRARGGPSAIAAETGIPASSFAGIETMDEAATRELATRLMEAYRPAVSSTRVA